MATYVPPPAPAGPLGVQLFPGDEAAEPLGHLVGAGAGWARVQALWRYIEPADTSPPTYAWGWSDNLFATLVAAGATPIGTIYNHPDWAASTPCGRVDRVPLSRYQAFLSALVERYDGDGLADAPRSPRVRHWEIMNEPDFNPGQAAGEADYGGCLGGDAPGYGELLRAAYLAIKGADPGAVVIFGGVAYDRFYNLPGYLGPIGPFDYGFTGDVIAWLRAQHGNEPAWPFFDQAALHVYNDFRNQWDGPQPYSQELVGKVAHFRANQLYRAGQFDLTDRPVALSEVSLPSMPADDYTDRGESLQALYPGQALARSLAAGVAWTVWFSAEDYATGDCGDPYQWLTFGLLRSEAVRAAAEGCLTNPLPGYSGGDHAPKPALTAYRVAGEQLNGASYQAQLAPGDTGSPQIEAHRLSRGGTAVIVAFTDTGERLGRRGSPALTRTMTFHAAVLPGWTGRIAITDHLGVTTTADGEAIVLTLTQAPVYVRPVPMAAAQAAAGARPGWLARIVDWLAQVAMPRPGAAGAAADGP